MLSADASLWSVLTDDLLAHRILRRPEVLTLIGVSSATLARWVQSSHFPRPVKLGPNAVGWREADIRKWLESREPVCSPASEGLEEPPEGRAEEGSSPMEADS